MNVLARARLENLLLAALAVLAVVVVVWTSRLPTHGELLVRERHLLPVFRPEDVTRIQVTEGSRRAVLVRQEPSAAEPSGRSNAPVGPGSGSTAETASSLQNDLLGLPAAEWLLVDPFETDADTAAVEKLLGTLRYATWEREVPGAEAEGFSAAAAAISGRRLELNLGDLRYRLRLGQDSVSPPGSKYVEVVRDEREPSVYVIEKALARELFPDPDTFRGRQVVPYRKRSVERVVLSSAAGVRRLERVGHDFHFDDMQDGLRAERTGVDRIFMALARASLDPFLDMATAKSLLGSDATVRVSVRPRDRTRPEASLEFGGDCPGFSEKVVAVRHVPQPLAGCVDRSVLAALREPADVLLDSGLFTFNADEVDHVRIEAPDAVLDMVRAGDGFLLREPQRVELDPEAAADRLARILDIKGELLPANSRPQPPRDASLTRVTLESASRLTGESVKETVRLGPALADGRRRVFRDADGAVLLISAESALAVRPDATLLKQQQIFDYGPDQVRRISVRAGSLAQTLERSAAGALTLREPKGHEVDGALAVELIDQLRSLRALSWVTDRSSKGFGLDDPSAEIKLTVEVDGQQRQHALAFGRSAAGGIYASVESEPGVFIAPRSALRAATTWLIARSGFSAEREAIVELSIQVKDRGAVVLRRIAGELTLQKGSRNFDPARLDELLDAIEALRPEAAVHIGRAARGEGLRRPLLSVTIKRRSPENVGMPPIRFSVGARDSYRDASIYYARLANVNATFALPRDQVQRLLDLF